MPAVALTDTNGLYGAVPFFQTAREAGVRPIIGAEVDQPPIASETSETDYSAGRAADQGESARAILLAVDREGYSQISQLITRRQLAAEPDAPPEGTVFKHRGVLVDEWENDLRLPRAPRNDAAAENEMAPPELAGERPPFDLFEELAALSAEHVVILSDHLPLLERLKGRENLYAELILTRERRGRCRRVYDFAREAGIPLAATADAHMGCAEDFELYRVLRAIGLLKTVETLEEDDLVTPEHRFKSEAEMRRTFRGLQEAVDNAGRIAERCRLELDLGVWKFPRYELAEGETPFSQLWKVTFEGLARRYRPLTQEVMERLKYELEVIERLGFCEYFLVVHEIVREAQRRGYLLVGRGSAANSVVSYALGLTGVDPLRYNLYFERFLNPERISPPDIDLDFSWKDRDDMVQWIFEHFGRERVALIATHICLRARQAVREVGKALGLAESEVNRFTRRLSGWYSGGKLVGEIVSDVPESRDLPLNEEPWRSVVAYADRIIGFPRHLSIHCGGLVITPDAIANHTPLQRATKGHVITQMEMHAVEALGLIKIDILSNRSLGVFRDCLKALGMEEPAGEELPV